MKIGTWAAIYFVVWWVTLFTVLPIGARSQVDAGEVVPGSEPGAPAKPRFFFLFGLTTLISAVEMAILWWLIENYWMV